MRHTVLVFDENYISVSSHTCELHLHPAACLAFSMWYYAVNGDNGLEYSCIMMVMSALEIIFPY